MGSAAAGGGEQEGGDSETVWPSIHTFSYMVTMGCPRFAFSADGGSETGSGGGGVSGGNGVPASA